MTEHSFLDCPLPQQEDVDTFMAKEDNVSAQDVIKRLDEQLNKYKFMEVHLQARRKKLVLWQCWGRSFDTMVELLKRAC